MFAEQWNRRPWPGLALVLLLTAAAWAAAQIIARGWVAPDGAAQHTAAQVQPEIEAFFQRFYAARAPQRSASAPPAAWVALTELAYRDYVLGDGLAPIAAKGADRRRPVSYTDVHIEVVSWDAAATPHGGIAEVAVSVTAHIPRPGGPDDLQPSSELFRVHRHLEADGHSTWFVVDFFDPNPEQWVSERAGLDNAVPASVLT